MHDVDLDGRIRLLFFTVSLGGGGAEMHTLRLLNHLDRHRFDVAMAVARGGGSYEADLQEDVALHVLDTGRFDSSTLRMYRAMRPLRRLVETYRPHVLCSVMDHASVPALYAMRGLTAPPRTVVCVQNSLQAKYERTMHPVRLLTRRMMARLYPQADRIVALSEGVADELRAMIPATRARTEVIYNAGWDDLVARRLAEPLPEARPEGPLIVACGRLTEQKGFPHLIDAIRQLRAHVPARLWILGDGPLRSSLEEQITRGGLADAVRLLGFQRNPFAYMAAADVFVLSSLWEGFGNVVVEAMACGTAVVSTDCPHGPGEIIEEGESGLLVPPGDAGALAAALQRVLRDPVLRDRLAAGGRARADAFHAAAIADRYGALFQQLTATQQTAAVGRGGKG